MNPDGVETIGKRIRGRRTALGLSQQQLAVRVGIGRKAIGYLETGKYQPSTRRLEQLAAALAVSTGWLLTGQEPASEQETAQTAGIAELQANQAQTIEAIRELERQLRDLYRLVERLAEQQIRYLSPGDPPWSDEP